MPGHSAPGINSQGSAETNLQIDFLPLQPHGHSMEVFPPSPRTSSPSFTFEMCVQIFFLIKTDLKTVNEVCKRHTFIMKIILSENLRRKISVKKKNLPNFLLFLTFGGTFIPL